MLPSQARSGLVVARLRPTSLRNVQAVQVRHFWPFHKQQPADWTSPLDPHYIRFHRRRHINTRAKLLKSLRRRSKWEWDCGQKPFFSPKHIRLASHWHGNGPGGCGTKLAKDLDQEDGNVKEVEDGDGYELSARERIWKEQMERMRKRVEEDPHEAIFGKRFEPFWGPLVPNWMREEMGLLSRQNKATPKQQQQQPKEPEESIDVVPESTRSSPAEQRTQPTPIATGYAYSSSTTWDSWTNKTGKTEWNSIDGKTNQYEYDPISNRMVVIMDAKSPQQTNLIQPKATGLRPNPRPITDGQSKSDASSKENTTGLRKAILIPQIANPLVGHSTKPNPEIRSTSTSENDVDSLTADLIRATMGKTKQQRKPPSMQAPSASHQVHKPKHLETALQRGAQAPRSVVKAPLRTAFERMQSKEIPLVVDLDDSAAHESTGAPVSSLPRSWENQADLLQADRIKRTAIKGPYPNPVPTWVEDMHARETARLTAENNPESKLRAERSAKAKSMLHAEVSKQKLAMKLHEERHTDVKRSAVESASDSTEAKYKSRVSALKDELDLAYKQSSRHADEFRNQIAIAQSSANKTESDNGQAMKSMESKYKEKVAALKKELDIAYRQSSVHADEFRDRISKLEIKLARAQSSAGSKQVAAVGNEAEAELLKDMRGEGDFCTNITKYANSDKWYKRTCALPKTTAGNVKESDRALIREIRRIYEKAYGIIGEESRPSGHISKGIPYASADLEDGWSVLDKKLPYTYTQDELENELAGKSIVEDPWRKGETKDAYRFRDDDLASEVRDTKHSPRQSATNEANDAYVFREDGLEADLQQAKNDAHVKDEETGAYRFQKDDLEAELASKTQIGHNPAEPAGLADKQYGYEKDDLESELKGIQGYTAPQQPSTEHAPSLRKRLAAEFSDVSAMLNEVKYGKSLNTSVNPVDGTSADGEPATGNYASPTGFVNYDPVFPQNQARLNAAARHQSTGEDAVDHDVEYVHYPRVRREERVFSGTRRVPGLGEDGFLRYRAPNGGWQKYPSSSGTSSSWKSHPSSSGPTSSGKSYSRSESNWKERATWTAFSAVVILGGLYLAGMAFEANEYRRIMREKAALDELQMRQILQAAETEQQRTTNGKAANGFYWK